MPLSEFQLGNQLFVKKQYLEAVELFLSHSSNFPQESHKCFERIAESYLRSKVKDRIKLAKDYYRKSIEIDPDYFRAMFGLSKILPNCSEERLTLMERAANLQGNYLLLLEIGDFYRSCKKQYEIALSFYHKAWEINPRDKDVYRKVWSLCSITKNEDISSEWSKLYQEHFK